MDKYIKVFSQYSNYIVAAVGLLALDQTVPHAKRYITNRQKDKLHDIQRVQVKPLQGLKQIFEEIKFKFYNIKGIKWEGGIFGCTYDNYWIDGVGYKISERKFNDIIKSTQELHNMRLEATDLVIGDDDILKNVFDIPKDMIPMIRESWKNRQPDLLARYDFLLGTMGELYFLEVNGDTCSGVIETGPAQRRWAEQLKLLQFNTLEANIAEGFKRIVNRSKKKNVKMFKNHNLEDECSLEYIRSLIEPVASFIFKLIFFFFQFE